MLRLHLQNHITNIIKICLILIIIRLTDIIRSEKKKYLYLVFFSLSNTVNFGLCFSVAQNTCNYSYILGVYTVLYLLMWVAFAILQFVLDKFCRCISYFCYNVNYINDQMKFFFFHYTMTPLVTPVYLYYTICVPKSIGKNNQNTFSALCIAQKIYSIPMFILELYILDSDNCQFGDHNPQVVI